jgi:hypothetical protein
VSDVANSTGILIGNINASKQARVRRGGQILPSTREMFAKNGKDAIFKSSKVYRRAWLFAPGRLKPSMFGLVENYVGVTGYYNPFTGEAR